MTSKAIEAMARGILRAQTRDMDGGSQLPVEILEAVLDKDLAENTLRWQSARRMALAALRALLTQEGLSRHMLAAFKAQACCEYAEWHISDEGEPMPPLATIDGDFNLNLVSAAMLTALVEEAERDA